jgi:hypothetical protein
VLQEIAPRTTSGCHHRTPQDRAQRFTRSEDNQEKPADPALRNKACGRLVDPPGAALVSTDGTEDDEIVGDQQSRI